jgi:hypothetical protein
MPKRDQPVDTDGLRVDKVVEAQALLEEIASQFACFAEKLTNASMMMQHGQAALSRNEKYTPPTKAAITDLNRGLIRLLNTSSAESRALGDALTRMMALPKRAKKSATRKKAMR